MSERAKRYDAKVYEAADKAIAALNRADLKLFGQMKTRLMKADELHIIREVKSTYDAALGLAKKRLLEVARLAYIAAMAETGKKRRGGIDLEWLLFWMDETDPVTMYKFIPEWERKKARLMEALPVAPDRGKEIDKALKDWTRQVGWAAIGVTDAATMEAFGDAGVEYVRWNAEDDDRTCDVCHEMDGKVYRIGKVPTKPHRGCRCWLTPVTKVSGE